MAGYYAMIGNLDWNVGRIRDALRETGLDDHTHIVFFSNHGDMHGSHGQFGKVGPYEESIRTPFIIGGEQVYGRRAGRFPTLVNHVDIAPTTLGLCGIRKPEWMEGYDYSHYRLPGEPAIPEPDSAYLQELDPRETVVRPWRGIVTRDGWKYGCLEGMPWLMFNLNEDPYEQANLAQDPGYRARRKQLNDRLNAWIKDTGDWFDLPGQAGRQSPSINQHNYSICKPTDGKGEQMTALKKQLIKIPAIYQLRISQLRMIRRVRNLYIHYAKERKDERLPYIIKCHQSLLRRKLGMSDAYLQENKIVNMSIALKAMNGIVIRPGETFSFWHLVGRPTVRKGYVEGMLLSQGEVRTGVGGGLCQLANLLFWLALHTPLEIKERHHHSFDPFPDDRRVLPFGSGASVFYNYIDLQFHNPTPHAFQFRLRLTDEHLKGLVCADQDLAHRYHVMERNHRFYQRDGKNYRQNEIWKKTIEVRSGDLVREDLMIRNDSEVKYPLPLINP